MDPFSESCSVSIEESFLITGEGAVSKSLVVSGPTGRGLCMIPFTLQKCCIWLRNGMRQQWLGTDLDKLLNEWWPRVTPDYRFGYTKLDE
ncbi:hypothetical protein GBA52_006531 [Prunus armeniaca]|nr:hypothetical protein GBA52_006531 [Prunus armeniaca]